MFRAFSVSSSFNILVSLQLNCVWVALDSYYLTRGKLGDANACVYINAASGSKGPPG